MRVHGETAFVLHSRHYSETSLTLDVMTHRYGRIGLLAKGARRRSSPWRGLLKPFQPLLIGWSGRGELPILIQAETAGDSLECRGLPLYCGFYLNELLLRLLHRHDPHEHLYVAYGDALVGLREGISPELTLRRFEKRLLDEIGYGLVLDHDPDSNTPIDSDAVYDYRLERGPVRIANPDFNIAVQGMRVRGQTLRAIAADALGEDHGTQREAKQLMRYVIDSHLAGRPLHTRRLFRSIMFPRSRTTEDLDSP